MYQSGKTLGASELLSEEWERVRCDNSGRHGPEAQGEPERPTEEGPQPFLQAMASLLDLIDACIDTEKCLFRRNVAAFHLRRHPGCKLRGRDGREQVLLQGFAKDMEGRPVGG